MSEPVRFERIPEIEVEGKPLGRHVHHDPRSLAYLVQPLGVPETRRWKRRTPILDQGSLGSCTGNATVGALGTDPYFGTLAAVIKAGTALDEALAVQLYSEATVLDPFDGTYPPEDTGSDGLSAAKAAKAAKLISGYLHMTSLAACQTAIKAGPFIVGTNWYEGMDSPDSSGVVQATGAVRGGHEYECIGFDVKTDLWEFPNSWGDGFGLAGHFYYDSTTLTKLLGEDGDATAFVPINAPAPVPPTPGAAPFLGASDAVAAHVARTASLRELTVPAWLERHFERWFNLPPQ